MTENPPTSTSTPTSPHAPGDHQKRIIVGLDQSDAARAALDWAAEHARRTECLLRAVSIVDWPTGLVGAGDGGLPLETLLYFPNEEQSQDLQRASQHIFDQIHPEPGWDLRFRVGHVGRVLTQESRDAHLLVIGTGEHVGLGRVLIGSTSHYCLSHASCPVVAVPGHQTGAR
jgi:nucleotide-binding universal stress UspA family protein